MIDVPIRVVERAGLDRAHEALRIGVPLPRGALFNSASCEVAGPGGVAFPSQAASLASWSDGSIKWLLVDCVLPLTRGEEVALRVHAPAGAQKTKSRLNMDVNDGGVDVETGALTAKVYARGTDLLVVTSSGTATSVRLCLTTPRGERCDAVVESASVEERGPVRVTVAGHGTFGPAAAPLRFMFRAWFVIDSTSIGLEVTIANPRAAVHPGGLWDLGDPGSVLFEDISLICSTSPKIDKIHWFAESLQGSRTDIVEKLWLYQDSSGGENWRSPNHVDSNGQETVRFRGYRAIADSREICAGHRASPVFAIGEGGFAVGVRDFWQNFPKALRFEHGSVSIGLFPHEAAAPFELQGGERKRHTVYFDVGGARGLAGVAALLNPVEVSVDPAWSETSGAIESLVAEARDRNIRYCDYVRQIVDGPASFASRRDTIDEFGWRNFGDLYADHEAIKQSSTGRFVSHYNNQYDFLYGAFVHLHRSGDVRWRRLLEDGARHTIDIDIYHTQEDKAALNGGLFWHTDHYVPAATSTHRTYSRANGGSGYGGGPSNEHNYTSGLLHFYYLTGDREAACAVRTLADWVCSMDDGSRTLFGILDDGPTGLASATRSRDFHKPGRGAGNSINALLDGYALTRERRYFDKAEELVRRCIHPADDVPALRLDDPENRWSYLVFLQALGKFLDAKLEMAETDFRFWFARDALLHYARWMAAHEVPYRDVLHKVEIPTETWSAHDIRKCHVFHLAAKYSDADEYHRFTERAEFFFRRCLDDLLSFETACLTRPLVILCVNGFVQGYYDHRSGPADLPARPNHSFGAPVEFVSQRGRWRQSFRTKLAALRTEIQRLARHNLHSLKRRIWR